jgi:hypothetical protein
VKSAGAWRLVVSIAGAIALGTFYSVLRGNSSGARDLLSNVSAPWLILPLLGGRFACGGRPLLGALVGVLVTFGALVAFNLTGSLVHGLGPHRTIEETLRTLVENGMLFRVGIASGVAFGALGAGLAGARSTLLIAVCAGLFMLEPLAWAAAAIWRGVPMATNASYFPLWVIEAGVGFALAALVWRLRRRTD